MSNDISGINTGRSQHTLDRQTKAVGHDNEAADSQSNQGASGTSAQDKVVLTDMASRLKSLEHKLSKQPEVDQDHVNRVRDAINRGNYRVNPDRVANKMMGFERDL